MESENIYNWNEKQTFMLVKANAINIYLGNHYKDFLESNKKLIFFFNKQVVKPGYKFTLTSILNTENLFKKEDAFIYPLYRNTVRMRANILVYYGLLYKERRNGALHYYNKIEGEKHTWLSIADQELLYISMIKDIKAQIDALVYEAVFYELITPLSIFSKLNELDRSDPGLVYKADQLFEARLLRLAKRGYLSKEKFVSRGYRRTALSSPII